ncbi:MAG: RNA polymerase sigma factor [Bacillota bacterium]|nr:RNA polymerase sigma factor [Bacillota bacterium]
MKDFDEIYRLYSKSIYRYLLYLTGDHHLSEDLLQETFYNAFKAIHKFEERSKVSTWLYTIARNTFLKYRNKNKKREILQFGDGMFEKIDLEMPDVIVERRDGMKAVISAIRRLEENYRQVILLRSIGELSFRDIGEMLEKNENWARITFYRAKLKLKKEMDDSAKSGGGK